VQDEKIFVEISQKRLAQLGLDFNSVISQLGQQNAVESAGVIDRAHRLAAGAWAASSNPVDDLKAFPIRAAGNSFRLGDIATVKRAYVDPPQVKVRDRGKEVLALGISMAKGGDIIELGQALKTATDEIRADLPVGIELRQFQNQSTVVAKSVGEFVHVLLEAVVIVLAVSSSASPAVVAAPDWRPRMVVGITIPLVLAITFVTMYYWGVGLTRSRSAR
jgi:multidrug efflux pump subunit AcrB